jgi:S1-C subfamily serine protease
MATTIPVSTVERVLGQILAKGYVARGWIGAAMQPVRIADDRVGLLVLSVESGAPAELAGLMVGDVIVSVAGNPVTRTDDVLGMLAGDVVGKVLTIELVRGGKPERVDLLVGERPRNRR